MTREEILTIAKPVLFNTPMVRAVDNGSKTMTRRVVKIPQGFSVIDHNNHSVLVEHDLCPGCVKQIDAPYDVGEYLYVRETWRSTGVLSEPYAYFADEKELNLIGESSQRIKLKYRWKPSIHMPKEAARTFLQVTGVKAERLQDIDDDGCKTEGIIYDEMDNPTGMDFSELWDSTVKKKEIDLYGWDANPWVWVYTFKKVEVENDSVSR